MATRAQVTFSDVQRFHGDRVHAISFSISALNEELDTLWSGFISLSGTVEIVWPDPTGVQFQHLLNPMFWPLFASMWAHVFDGN